MSARALLAVSLALSAQSACGDDPASRDPEAEAEDEQPATARDAAMSERSDGGTRDAASSGNARADGGANAAVDATAGGTRPPLESVRDGGGPVIRSDGGSARADASTSPPATGDAGAGPGVSGIPEPELEMLRQVCVDEINMYRATLTLPPLQRADATREGCSDQGAKKDGDLMQGHASAGNKNPCAMAGMRIGFGSQNTCPGWPVGRRGTATIADALKRCLMQMWAEGEPPQGEMQCIAEYRAGNSACFLAHGHYINMKGNSKGVSCGFYRMTNGSYWMNQDFF